MTDRTDPSELGWRLEAIANPARRRKNSRRKPPKPKLFKRRRSAQPSRDRHDEVVVVDDYGTARTHQGPVTPGISEESLSPDPRGGLRRPTRITTAPKGEPQ